MGICQDLLLSFLSLSFTLRMMFLPRPPLFMFIAFLGYYCNTIIKADDTMKSCLSVEEDCNQNPREDKIECQEEGKKCQMECFNHPAVGTSKQCGDEYPTCNDLVNKCWGPGSTRVTRCKQWGRDCVWDCRKLGAHQGGTIKCNDQAHDDVWNMEFWNKNWPYYVG